MSRPLADPVFDIGRDLQNAYDEGYRQGRYDEKVEAERKTCEWLHEYLQTAVDFGIITETQASRLMDMIDDSEDNT